MTTLRQLGELVGKGSRTSMRSLGETVRFVASDDRISMRTIELGLTKVNYSVAESTRPLYRRVKPAPRLPTPGNSDFIDLSHETVHLPPFGEKNTVLEATKRLDARAAATINAAVGANLPVSAPGDSEMRGSGLLEKVTFGKVAPDVLIPKAKCLAVLAYNDFFADARAGGMPSLVSQAIRVASPGWCGTFGPFVRDTITFIDANTGDTPPGAEGNYDMSQMHLLQIAYRYYDDLDADAREHLITVLLGGGHIRRLSEDDTVTSGRVPKDFSRAGVISPVSKLLGKRIGETENHILTIHTARYLTNQLLYQRDHHPDHDNRHNGGKDFPTCTDLMTALLRNILIDDFSEYNAKNYQNEVRAALLNLCSYAYDQEVRLGARMVLDYLSAHMAVSSNDVRRMIPFRRRNEDPHSKQTPEGFMDIGLLETTAGADPMAPHFAILSGNTRAYAKGTKERTNDWTIGTFGNNGHEAVADVLSDYRLPPSIHDLFITDRHRRFFQKLHRSRQGDPEVTGRNADNHEIYAASPSYLITAGGSPADFAIDPRVLGKVIGKQDQQLGVAVTTSFMPTSGSGGSTDRATELIQFSSFSQDVGQAINYGVAPDFACGHQVHLPPWCRIEVDTEHERLGFFKSETKEINNETKEIEKDRPGFFLAFVQDGTFTAMEALDTWLHPEVNFEDFKASVRQKNGDLADSGLKSNVEAQYTTHNGNRLQFVIWNNGEREECKFGARVLSSEFANGDGPETDPADREGGTGTETARFLRGTVMDSPAEGVVEIKNFFLKVKLTLNMAEQGRPIRSAENHEVEDAVVNREIWVNLAWKGPTEGNFFRPFNTLAAAVAAAGAGGLIRMMAGTAN